MSYLMGMASKARLFLCEMVSADRNRFVSDSYNLDLSYITDRLIAMSCPMEGMYVAWRNRASDVAKMLSEKHGPDNFAVWDLTFEGNYDHSIFGGRVHRAPFADHHAPPLELLWKTVLGIDEWLSGDPNRVAAVHCMAGKGRTGTVIAAYLIYSGVCGTASEALSHFAKKRSKEGNGVASGSQKRYVEYIERIKSPRDMAAKMWSCDATRRVTLRSVSFGVVPLTFSPQVEVVELAFPHAVICPAKGPNAVPDQPFLDDIPVPATEAIVQMNQSLQGDVMIRVFYNGLSGRVYLLRFAFNTYFIDEPTVVLRRHQLDGPIMGSLKDEWLPETFRVEMEFDLRDETESSSMGTPQPRESSTSLSAKPTSSMPCMAKL